MSVRLLNLLLLAGLLSSVDSLGCLRTICSANPRNELKACPGADGTCGHYKGRRKNNQLVEAVDLICPHEEPVFAPFDGEISYHQPFGGEHEKSCADQGARIDGTGQWRGYYVLITSVTLRKYGGKVQAGDQIGVAGNIECNLDNMQQSNQNYLRVELFREGKSIDPTHHLVECMCTGQICETNINNALVGEPFKSDTRYNGVRGWELRCPMASDTDEYNAHEESERAAVVYSPIDGDLIGRIRLEYVDGVYSGCGNEGLFISGTGKWTDYEVRLYNVRYRDDLGFGKKRIEQGQPVGVRLACAGSSDTIFVEVRFQGAVVNITDAVSAKNCKHPTFHNIF
ncbi:Protein K05F1.5 [Aphelenchoides avenae]|nr:Protein K05F1.5 [Aphelenchus avenae]